MEALRRRIARLEKDLGHITTGANIHEIANIRMALHLSLEAYEGGCTPRQTVLEACRFASRYITAHFLKK